jgi:hypothetical protein
VRGTVGERGCGQSSKSAGKQSKNESVHGPKG